jgi:hypothetical protein
MYDACLSNAETLREMGIESNCVNPSSDMSETSPNFLLGELKKMLLLVKKYYINKYSTIESFPVPAKDFYIQNKI